MREPILWLIQRITGAVLFLGLAVHFYVMHFIGPEQLTYEAVSARLADPAWIAFNIAFLLSAIYHGFNGLWGIAIEYLKGGALSAAKGAVLLSAAGLSAVGIYILTLG